MPKKPPPDKGKQARDADAEQRILKLGRLIGLGKKGGKK